MSYGKDPLLNANSMTQIQTVLESEESFRFDCTACGACCQGPGTVYFTPEDLENIYALLGLQTRTERKELNHKLIQSRQNGYLVHSAGTACYLLGRDNKCAVYAARPLQCRTFPFWPSTFESAKALEQIARDCPGTMFKKTTITRQANRSKKSTTFSALATARRVNLTRRLFLAQQDDANDYFMI